MQLAGFIRDNVRWNVKKDFYTSLLAQPVNAAQLCEMLDRIAVVPLTAHRKKINLNATEFCLNEIALFKGRSALQRIATGMFDGYWKAFLRLKKNLGKDVTFPSCDGFIRIERAAEIIVRATQCVYTAEQYIEIKKKALSVLTDDREKYLFDDVLSLYVIKYYCMSWDLARKKDKTAEWCISRLLPANADILHGQYILNNRYRFKSFDNGIVKCGADCMGNSQLKNSGGASWDCNIRITERGRNVFDTFCNHRFGRHIAEFSADNGSLNVRMRLFIQDNCRVCNYTVTNTGNKKRTLTVDFSCGADVSQPQYFRHDGASCAGYMSEGVGHYFACLAVGVPCEYMTDSVAGKIKCAVSANGSFRFSIVSVCDTDIRKLTQSITNANCYGFTRCGKVTDEWEDSQEGLPMVISCASNLVEQERSEQGKYCFSHRFGDCNVSTMADDEGNECTLINGFFANMSSVALYSVGNNKVTRLNCGAFEVSDNGMRYSRKDCLLQLNHRPNSKVYSVSFNAPRRLLVRFNFEKPATVRRQGNVFVIKDDIRSYTVSFCGNIESFTTNPLECNSNRLRYKLSGDDKTSRCLAVCLKSDIRHELAFSNNNVVEQGQSLITESLLSAYLNYINEKNCYLLANRLVRWDSLTLSAMCYTNTRFVKKAVMYLAQSSYISDGQTQYYDANGNIAMHCDSLALTLASIYYASITNDTTVFTDYVKEHIDKTLFRTDYRGKQLCVVALALKKLARMQTNRTQTLIRYSDIRKQISCDKELYPYAQAIGAVPLNHPSKQRLKDLVNKYGIPRCWYYVSQLENLYGVDLCCDRLSVRPLVDGQVFLEQFAIVYKNKRLDTVFKQSPSKGMSVNGIACYQPFNPESLSKSDNKLEVRY